MNTGKGKIKIGMRKFPCEYNSHNENYSNFGINAEQLITAANSVELMCINKIDRCSSAI